MRNSIEAALGILGFFIPAEVVSAVLLVFTMENVLDYLFTTHIPPNFSVFGWVAVYLIGTLSISIVNYYTATDEEREELSEDLSDL